MTFEEWEEKQGISPSSPEADYAEKAWNAALKEAKRIAAENQKMPWNIMRLIKKIMTKED